jgi:beta-aspartyl-peptidase (threonine type)
MLRYLTLFVLLISGPLMAAEPIASDVVLAIHGGIGLDKKDMTPELAVKIRADLETSLKAGYAVIAKGGDSLDAVQAAIVVMEDSPLFNAGKGAVFTHDGRNELDASIMEGKTKRAGSVAGVTTIKNPILAARAVMEKTKHVMLIGAAADTWAKSTGLEIVDPKYFWTEQRWNQLQEQLRKEKEHRDHGTVGAVALDKNGVLAAGTSTGGMSNKQYGRVGDSPIIGAGTYADNAACAVSATGHGEYFIRHAVAHSIVDLMKYKQLPVNEAADEVIQRTLKPAGGEGGVVCLDHRGNFAASYNTEGMYRGYITRAGQVKTLLYEE